MWAIEAARKVKLDDFTAGRTFVQDFKKAHRISSRRITKFVTLRTRADEPKIIAEAKKFVNEINEVKLITPYDDEHVWNTDQSGFNYEIVSRRTLSDNGEKKTFTLVQNMNALTHSYTIQVLISNAGVLAPKLFICFQEKTGAFGPKVAEEFNLNTQPNMVRTSTTSDKMTKNALEYWISTCLEPRAFEKTLLLQDSWTGQKDQELFNRKLTEPNNLEIKFIPPRTTKYAQPLDVYFFRQYKLAVRCMQDAIRSTGKAEAEEKLRSRIFIMKMHSVVYNQLISP